MRNVLAHAGRKAAVSSLLSLEARSFSKMRTRLG
jgi:hypothetical protein